jgi:hypothetical protein
MVDTIAVQKALDSLSHVPTSDVGLLREQSADHSSSLSELEDNIDDREDPKSKRYMQDLERDDDSEAETERLEDTPRKQRLDAIATYTPSRLGNEMPSNDENVDVDSTPARDRRIGQVNEVTDDASPSSPLSDDPDATPVDVAGLPEALRRKRKRESNQDDHGNEIDVDEPVRKRAGGVENDHLDSTADDGHIEIRQPLDDSPAPMDSVENEDEAIDEQPIPVKALKGKKPKGKGKKGKGKASDSSEKLNSVIVDEIIVEPEETGEGEAEDEDTGSPAEQGKLKEHHFYGAGAKYRYSSSETSCIRQVLWS